MYDYYLYWNNYYTTQKTVNDECGEVIAELINHGWINHEVIIDGVVEQVLLFENKEVAEEKTGEPEKMIICPNKEHINWGSIINIEDGRSFIIVTKPDWNEIYVKARVEELTDELMTPSNADYNQKIQCIIANKLFYDDISWVNQQNVFEDVSLKGLLVAYNEYTKLLSVLDKVYVNSVEYYIVKIDNKTLKEYDEEFGILQMVIVETSQGDVFVNGEQSKSVVLPEVVKDRILNSVSRAILNEYNKVKRGDYINFTYDRDKKGNVVTETYLAVNKPTMMSVGYDKSLLYLCESAMNLLNDKGTEVNVPVYFENNRMRIDKTSEDEYSKFANSSFMVVVQNNDTTLLRCKSLKRLIIDGKPYEITGIDDTAKGLISIGLNSSQLTPDDNLEIGIANYYSQMEEVNGGSIEPETPVSDIKIVEANGEVSLYKGYENEYYLNLVESDVVWSVDKDWIDIRQNGTRCWISFNELKYIGETITLTALVGDKEYTLIIKCVDM